MELQLNSSSLYSHVCGNLTECLLANCSSGDSMSLNFEESFLSYPF